MPNQRSPGQKLLNLPVNEEFLSGLDAGVVQSGAASRAAFVREAIAEKLKSLGLKLPDGLTQAPLRLGKGGRPPSKYPEHSPAMSAHELNENPTVAPSSKLKGLGKNAGLDVSDKRLRSKRPKPPL